MRDELKKKAKEFLELQQKVESLDEEIDKLRRETFDAASEDTEKKARELFSEVGGSSSQESSKTDEIDELQDRKESLKEKRKGVKEDIWDLLVDVTFPLNEEINTEEGYISFPFSESIDQEVLDGIDAVLGDEYDNGKVTAQTDALKVDTESVDEAIEAVQQWVRNLRQSAEALLDVESHVEAVYERDEKVAAMLYVLYEADEDSLTKKEMEERIGLDSGDLRGQLYHVLNSDPYLTKNDQQVSLTSTGEEVIREYLRRHDKPSILSGKSDQDEDSDQEITA